MTKRPGRPRSEALTAMLAASLLASVSVLAGLSNLAFNVIVARVGGADAYSSYGALTTILTIAGVLAVATNYTVARRVARADVLDRKLLLSCLLACWPWIVIGVNMLALAPLIGGFIRVGSVAPVITAVVVFLVTVAAGAPMGILIGLRRFRAIALLNLLGAGSRLLAAPFLAPGSGATSVALAAAALTSLVSGTGALAVVLWHMRRPLATSAAPQEREGGLETETMGAALLAGMLWSLWSVPLLLARHGLTPQAAGVFTAAQVLAGSLLFLALPAVTAFFPAAARDRSFRVVLLGLGALAAVCVAGIAFLTVAGPRLVGVLYGGQFEGTSVLFAALTTSAALVACTNYIAWMVRATRRLVWVAFAGASTAVAAELTVGALLHLSTIGDALLPAIAVVLGLATIVLVIPQSAYVHLETAATLVAGRVRAGTRRPPSDLRHSVGRLRRVITDRAVASRTSPPSLVVAFPAEPILAEDPLGTTRRRLVIGGVACVIGVGIVGDQNGFAGVLAGGAIALFTAAVVCGVISARPRSATTWCGVTGGRTRWWPAFLVAGGGAALVAQSWFVAGTEIAGGDVSPVEGTAWLARMFLPWNWTGSNLGGPAATERQLPWASVLEATHSLGLSEAFAQRLWLTLVFAGGAIAMVALLRVLGIGRLGAVAGSAVYLLNTHVIVIVPNDVFMLSMALVPGFVALLLAVARGTVRLRVALPLVVAGAPLVGYMDQQPALVLMLVVAILLCPVAALYLGGRAAATRCLRGLVVGGAVLLVASAYWVVPSLIQDTGVAVSRLSSLSDWTWTEGRANLANGLWLNISWGWAYPQYFPFAGSYGQQPLELLKFAIPAVAFAALALPAAARHRLRLRVATIGGALAVAVIFVGTGTNLPGSVVFNVLYNLPLGWLLREPAHFMGAAALGMGLLIGVGVDAAAPALLERLASIPRTARIHGAVRLAPVSAVLAVAVVTAFPLVSGAVIPGTRPTLPSEHVAVPQYWTDVADYSNSLSGDGNVLVLPPDDFYQATYTWGYSGSDSFIADLFTHRVLDPLPGGYLANDIELMGAVDSIDSAILDHDWQRVQVLAAAVDAPWLLVRDDITPPPAGSSPVDPAQLVSALQDAPGIPLVHRSGPLLFYRVGSVTASPAQSTAPYATVTTNQPNLDILSSLPAGTTLVTSSPLPGAIDVTEIPPVTRWVDSDGSLTTTVAEPAGRVYSPVGLNHSTVDITATAGAVSLAVPVTERVADSDFSNGPWSPLGDCDEVHGQNNAGLGATVRPGAGPSGEPALVLSAHFDTACVRQAISWSGGDLLLSMSTKNVSGVPPRVCLYEVELSTCAKADPMPTGSGWQLYRSIVHPDPGISHLILFVYADGSGTATPSVDEYTDVQAAELPGVAPVVDVVGTPTDPVSPPSLLVTNESYSSLWSGPAGAAHVVVDGMFNGWLQPTADAPAAVTYSPGVAILAGDGLSAVGGLAALVLALTLTPWARVRRAVRLDRVVTARPRGSSPPATEQ